MPPHAISTLTSSVKLMIIASVVIVSIIGWVVKPLYRGMSLNPYRVREKGEVYRLLTAGWLHADIGHLGLNMFSFYVIADSAIDKLGPLRFVLLYISSVVIAFVPSTLRHMHQPQYDSVGASGAIAAVIFSAILLNPSLRLYAFFVPIPIPGYIFGIIYLVYSAWSARSSKDHVNHEAHFAGAFYGALLTFGFEPDLVVRNVHSFF